MGWTNPSTAVVGDFITAAFWNTSGRDNLNFLFGNINALVATTVKVKQTTTGLGAGFQSISAASAHYANVRADDSGNAFLENDAGSYLALTPGGDITGGFSTILGIPYPSANSEIGSTGFAVDVGNPSQFDVTSYTVTNGGKYRLMFTVCVVNKDTAHGGDGVVQLMSAAGGTGTQYAQVGYNLGNSQSAVVFCPLLKAITMVSSTLYINVTYNESGAGFAGVKVVGSLGAIGPIASISSLFGVRVG